MATLAEKLRKERRENFFSDFIVTIEDKTFPCHRLILAVNSGFFDKALRTDMKEKNEGKLELKGVAAETFELLLKYMYHDEDIFTKENVFDVVMASDQLQIESLVSAGRQFLSKNLSADNFARVYSISKLYHWEDLEKTAWSFLEENLDKVDPIDLGMLSHKDMKRLVSSEHLVTRSEDVVVKAVLRWVTLGACAEPDTACLDENGRVEYLAELLQSCRYCLVSSNFLCEIFNKNRFVNADPRCRELVQEIFCHKAQLDTHQHGCIGAALRRPTNSIQDVRIMIFKQNLEIVQADNFYKDSQPPSLQFPKPQSNFCGGAFYNGITYFEVSEYMTKIVYEYDPQDQKVTCCNKSENLRGYVTLAFLPVGNSLVALRGSVDKSCYIYIETMKLPCKPTHSWVFTGLPSIKGMDVEFVSSIGSKLLIFWKNSNPGSLTIECYDLDHQKSYVLDAKLTPSTSVRTFKKRDEVFALQGDGMLWRVQALEDPPYVKMVQEKQIWTSQEELHAVILVSNELVVHRKKPEPFVDIQWLNRKSVDVFTKTHEFSIHEYYEVLSIFHTLIYKKDTGE